MKYIGKYRGVSRSMVGFTLFVILLCILNFVINTINGQTWYSDFKVYYLSAKDLISGGKVYLQSFGLASGLYKYSPVSLLFFLPYTVFSFEVAAVIHAFVLSLAFLFSFILTRGILKTYFFPGFLKKEGLLLSLAVVCCLLHLVRELHLGNINIILIMFCLLALRCFLTNKSLAGGIILGIVVLIKPYYLILMLPLLFRKKIKSLIGLSITLLAGFLLPFLLFGIDRSLTLFHGWWQSIALHADAFPGKNSMDYLLLYYLFPNLPGLAGYLIISAAGILASWFIMVNHQLEKMSPDFQGIEKINFSFEWFLLIALIPNLVRTDSEHFLASLMIITFIIYFIAVRRKLWLAPVMIALVFFYGANSTDLLGKEFSDKLFTMGLLGISNLLLIVLSLFLFLDFRKKTLEKYSNSQFKSQTS